MAVLLVGVCSEGSVWLVREVRQVLRLLGGRSKTKNWVDCNTLLAQSPQSQPLSSRPLRSLPRHLRLLLPLHRSQHCAPLISSRSLSHLHLLLPPRLRSPTASSHLQSQTHRQLSSLLS